MVPISFMEAVISMMDELTSSTESPSLSALMATSSTLEAIWRMEADVSEADAESLSTRSDTSYTDVLISSTARDVSSTASS